MIDNIKVITSSFLVIFLTGFLTLAFIGHLAKQSQQAKQNIKLHLMGK